MLIKDNQEWYRNDRVDEYKCLNIWNKNIIYKIKINIIVIINLIISKVLIIISYIYYLLFAIAT